MNNVYSGCLRSNNFALSDHKNKFFDKCLFMGERRRFAVCLFRNPTLNGCRISHKIVKTQMPESTNKLSLITAAGLLKPSRLS